MKLKNGRSLFQLTVEKSLRLTALPQVYVVTNAAYKFLVLGQVEELGQRFDEENVLIEPVGRNTLPVILYGVKEIQKRHGDDLVAVFPSDHLIENVPEFIETVRKGLSLAAEHLLTFGVKPARPHTGYGYIRPGEPLGAGYRVAEFKEKPDEKTALDYVEKGYLWNSGMFLFHTAVFAGEVKSCCPEVDEAFS
ncbi:MAG: sugar phosphate nucleotidyltransferase, partial [Desulfotomaculales bacterium]